MAKMTTLLYLTMATVLLCLNLIVSEANGQPHMTSTRAGVARTLQPPSLRTGIDDVIQSDRNYTDRQTNAIKTKLAKSILDVILSTICGKGQRFNLKKSRCMSSSSGFVRGFGNPAMGK